MKNLLRSCVASVACEATDDMISSIDVINRSQHFKKEGKLMHDKKELCDRINSLYPEIGECGLDVKVDFDKTRNAWVVDLKKEGHELKTFLEPLDANTCMEGKQCLSLGLQIAQLLANIKSV